MTFELALFLFLGIAAATSALLMILQKNPVMSVLYMVANFVCIAGLYLLLQAQFLAVMQVIVYAGGIMVLFLFIIMLLNLADQRTQGWHRIHKRLIPIGMSVLIFAEIVYVLITNTGTGAVSGEPGRSPTIGTVESVGRELFTRFLFPFEIVSLLLLAAIVGAVVLAKKKI